MKLFNEGTDILICRLFQKLQCHFIVTEIPWEGESVLEKKKCAY